LAGKGQNTSATSCPGDTMRGTLQRVPCCAPYFYDSMVVTYQNLNPERTCRGRSAQQPRHQLSYVGEEGKGVHDSDCHLEGREYLQRKRTVSYGGWHQAAGYEVCGLQPILTARHYYARPYPHVAQAATLCQKSTIALAGLSILQPPNSDSLKCLQSRALLGAIPPLIGLLCSGQYLPGGG
jgi:hypothetical protein